ncbi:MAG: hypothetical protein PHS92_04975 [Candidatus Gracilibacteria bacterium]|nr:hypothetical protein [Candidatus Gracilibacteria bacterium]
MNHDKLQNLQSHSQQSLFPENQEDLNKNNIRTKHKSSQKGSSDKDFQYAKNFTLEETVPMSKSLFPVKQVGLKTNNERDSIIRFFIRQGFDNVIALAQIGNVISHNDENLEISETFGKYSHYGVCEDLYADLLEKSKIEGINPESFDKMLSYCQNLVFGNKKHIFGAYLNDSLFLDFNSDNDGAIKVIEKYLSIQRIDYHLSDLIKIWYEIYTKHLIGPEIGNLFKSFIITNEHIFKEMLRTSGLSYSEFKTDLIDGDLLKNFLEDIIILLKLKDSRIGSDIFICSIRNKINSLLQRESGNSTSEIGYLNQNNIDPTVQQVNPA